MSKSGSSKRWLERQAKDKYIAKAKSEGYRSRAVYKLQELDEKDNLFKPGMVVVDLGAAPGGWSQYAIQKVKKSKSKSVDPKTDIKVFALDLLPIDPINGVSFIQGDFSYETVAEQLFSCINNKKVDIVICDIAPNLSGIRDVDQSRTIYLVELALEFAVKVLNSGGSFVTKIFQGEGFDQYLVQIRSKFAKVKVRKPKASRDESTEVYIVATGFRNN